jgi:hypothetical protein
LQVIDFHFNLFKLNDMRKITLGSLALVMLVMSCKKSASPDIDEEEPQAITQRACGAEEVLQRQLAEDPSMRSRMDAIESYTARAIQTGEVSRLVNGVIEIPVVVHVLYNTATQNISDAQINSQIAVLNEDYQNLNADRTKLPANSFQSVSSTGMNVRFVLARAPIHKSTKTKSWSTNDAMKHSNRGGDDAIDPTNNLNIWVCNLGQGLLGYAQFPGGPLATDGVVILYSAFGSRAKYPAGRYVTSYDLGRTATHEVGHWMNLRHIWGDDGGACSGSDLVGDTPNQGRENYGCPSYPHVSCSNGSTGDMFMNYMDYTDDACMYIFSNGQKDRAMAVFASGGPRAAIGH